MNGFVPYKDALRAVVVVASGTSTNVPLFCRSLHAEVVENSVCARHIINNLRTVLPRGLRQHAAKPSPHTASKHVDDFRFDHEHIKIATLPQETFHGDSMPRQPGEHMVTKNQALVQPIQQRVIVLPHSLSDHGRLLYFTPQPYDVIGFRPWPLVKSWLQARRTTSTRSSFLSLRHLL